MVLAGLQERLVKTDVAEKMQRSIKPGKKLDLLIFEVCDVENFGLSAAPKVKSARPVGIRLPR